MIVRNNLLFREAETGEEACIFWVRALAGKLRLGVNRLRAVHAAGADADDDAGKAGDQLPQTDALKIGVLGRHMAARKDDEVRRGDARGSFRVVRAVQHVEALHGIAAFFQRSTQLRRHVRRAHGVGRVGGDEQRPERPLRQRRAQRVRQSVFGKNYPAALQRWDAR